jgi:hypothetical protein
MSNDHKLVKYLVVLLTLPLTLAVFSGDRFRYPCQDPSNWDKDFCKPPICDVTRTCPEHIFKGQRDPRLGPPKDGQTQTPSQSSAPTNSCVVQKPLQGADCGK